jgi:antitoxin MazE
LLKFKNRGNSAALRLPAAALKEAGLQIGQKLQLRSEAGKFLLEPAPASLDELVARITPENLHARR